MERSLIFKIQEIITGGNSLPKASDNRWMCAPKSLCLMNPNMLKMAFATTSNASEYI